MTGLVLLAAPPTREHLRLQIKLTGGPHRELWFWDRRGLGTVRLLDADQAAVWLNDGTAGERRLEITAAELRQQLGHSKRRSKWRCSTRNTLRGLVTSMLPKFYMWQRSAPCWAAMV